VCGLSFPPFELFYLMQQYNCALRFTLDARQLLCFVTRVDAPMVLLVLLVLLFYVLLFSLLSPVAVSSDSQ
jgi:hypothetical protein